MTSTAQRRALAMKILSWTLATRTLQARMDSELVFRV